MTTIANVIDRIYRDYLTPPGEQPVRFQVGSGGINTSSTTLPVTTAMLTAEQKDAIGVGSLIEKDDGELVLVEGVTGDITSLTVRRAMYDTTAVAASEGDYLYLLGEDHKPRKAVFDAVADAVTMLYPRLYQKQVEEVYASNDPIELDSLVAMIDDVEYASGSRYVPLQGWDFKRNFPYASTGKALQVRGISPGTSLLVYYRRRATRPSAESDTLANLYIEESWVKPIMVGAVAQVIANKDLDQSTIDFITEALESQGFQVGQGADIRNSLLQYQDFLVQPLSAALAQETEDRVVYSR